MAVVAQEPGVVVPLTHVVRDEVEAVRYGFPIRDQLGHVVVHGDVRILVYRSADLSEVPAPVVPCVVEGTEVEGLGRGDDEEVPFSRILVHEPIGRLGKQQPVVASAPDEVILVGRTRVQ
jgi:hypothetical protein